MNKRATRTKRVIRWSLAGLVLAAAAVTSFFVFYHPPMRLMPAPLLFRDTGVQFADLEPALADGSSLQIYYATNRLPFGPRDSRLYSVGPDLSLHLGEASLRIGDTGSTLTQIYEWSTNAGKDDRPFIHLEHMNEEASLSLDAPPDAAVQGWLNSINASLSQSRVRDILVYVHGANTTVERAAGQASQLRHFSGRNAVVVLFAWPTAENFLRYSTDVRNAYGSAPHLARLIRLLAEGTDARSVNVFTYSAGSTVGSDGLALLARQDPAATSRVGEVIHAAPDADFRRFVDDMKAYAGLVGRVTTAVNLGDSALRLAAVINRGSRAGRPDLRELSPEAAGWLLDETSAAGTEVIQVSPETMPDLPPSSHTFWYEDPWVSSDVLLALLFHLPPASRGLTRVAAPNGGIYWTFPADYADNFPALRQGLVSDLRRSGAIPQLP